MLHSCVHVHVVQPARLPALTMSFNIDDHFHLKMIVNINVITRILERGIADSKSRLAIRVLNYCKPRINAKRLNDVTATEARGFITCTLSGC